MSLKLLIAAVTLAWLTLGPAHAAIISINATGTIASVNHNGDFARYQVGDAVTYQVVLDMASATVDTQVGIDGYGYGFRSDDLTNATVKSATVTVGGETVVFPFPITKNAMSIRDATRPMGLDFLYNTSGSYRRWLVDGRYQEQHAGMAISLDAVDLPFGNGAFGIAFDRTLAPGQGGFTFYDADTLSDIGGDVYGYLNTISFRAGVLEVSNPVPEPASVALLIGGLLALGAGRRRLRSA